MLSPEFCLHRWDLGGNSVGKNDELIRVDARAFQAEKEVDARIVGRMWHHVSTQNPNLNHLSPR